VKSRRTHRFAKTAGALALAGTSLLARPAAADVTLLDKDGWNVFINGRMQAFFNYSNGEGQPREVLDANGTDTRLLDGGIGNDGAVIEVSQDAPLSDPGKIEELRIRTGFTGNVLGFGIRKKLTADTDVLGYTAVTTIIESTDRRKYQSIFPDWRESFLKVTGPWGSVLAGRSLTLYSRGATEITYLYGFKYGLGFPGNVSFNGPTAGHVGFGVLGNGFGAGVAYATPNLGGAQLTVGLYDATVFPNSAVWQRARWPRLEGELTYEMKLANLGMFKLFGNGMWQKIYRNDTIGDDTLYGGGAGGRVEIGPVKLGLAGHYGKGVGMNFALDTMASLFHPGLDDRPFRTFDGAYAQLMVSPLKFLDVMAGAGMNRVRLLKDDQADTWKDDDVNPATPTENDDGNPASPDSVGHIPIKEQIGLSGGVAGHISENLHVQLEYFRAIFNWYKPSPAIPDSKNPSQKLHFVNVGVTYDF